MAIKIDDLQPYAAFLLFVSGKKSSSRPDREAFVESLMNSMKTTFNVAGKIVVDDCTVPGTGRVVARALQVQVSSKSPWTRDNSVVDVVQQLIVLLECDGTLGVAVSDSGLRAEVEKFLLETHKLQAVAGGVLENALIRSDLRTLWLRGSHRKTLFKADSKVLTGTQLESALNPLDDRTFIPSSARAGTGLPASASMRVIGVSPDRSYVWIGPTNGMGDLCRRFRGLMEFIADRSKTTRTPLPILARALAHAPPPNTVRDAFDFDFASAETAVGVTEQDKLLLESIQNRLRIETEGRGDQDFAILVTDQDNRNPMRADRTWRIEVVISLTDRTATPTLAPDSDKWPWWNDFRKLLAKKTLWSVWYETGHSLNAGQWAKPDARASSFDGTYVGAQFPIAKWDVATEKPLTGRAVNWSDIGRDKSLFSWWIQEGMQCCFPAFAAKADKTAFAYTICDDGSNELGDFIVLARHPSFSASNNPSPLALIMVHMKAASGSFRRQMAPKQYEEVLGQATKNLGRVDFADLRDYFLTCAAGGTVPFWHWKNQKFAQLLARGSVMATGSPMHRDLAVFDGRRAHVHVVVVQPHQDVPAFEAAMNANPVDFKTRMLCTLLCAADGAARASSARLQVVMSR